MFFSAYLGDAEGFRQWRLTAGRHARSLGLSLVIETRDFGEESRLGLAWLSNGPQPPRRRLVETEGEIAATTYADDTAGRSSNVIALRAFVPERELTFTVPLATPQHLYYARVRSGWVLSDDLRLMAGVVDARIDPHAIYLLFQYGAVPPGVALYRGVQRVPNGHRLVVGLAAVAARCTRLDDRDGSPPLDLVPEDVERAVTDRLDTILAPLPRGAVLYFSGGVDSGLLAARAAHLGRHDMPLISFAFDTADDEYRIASKMAAHLGLRCERVSYVPVQAVDVLERAAREYSFPFGDISTIPTNLLVHASLPHATPAATVVEGTGADGAFGLGALYQKWHRVYAMPRALRRLIAGAYDRLALWRSDSRLERLARFVRKSAELPLPYSQLAQDGLRGIAYDAPAEARSDLSGTGTTTLEYLGRGMNEKDRLSLFDLLWVCAGRMAPKSFDPLRTRGIRPVYPFLEPAMVSLSMRLSWDVKCPMGVPKGLLKQILARAVPEEWVYRRKMGFTRVSSARATFQSARMQEFLHDVVLSPRNPVREFCRIDVVRQIIDHARHDTLSVGAYTFLWTVAFTTAWLRSKTVVGGGRDALGSAPTPAPVAEPSISC